ncbi:MAG: response regulator [Rhodospirillales bacterium]
MGNEATVYIIDDDVGVRESLSTVLVRADFKVDQFSSAKDFLDFYVPSLFGCILLDIRMPEMDGITLQSELIKLGCQLPIIFITGYADVPTAVHAVKKGAFEFIEKPVENRKLIDIVDSAFKLILEKECDLQKIQMLTKRERDIFHLLAEGVSNKTIAAQLNISVRTVEFHRKNILEKLGVNLISGLIKISKSISPTS